MDILCSLERHGAPTFQNYHLMLAIIDVLHTSIRVALLLVAGRDTRNNMSNSHRLCFCVFVTSAFEANGEPKSPGTKNERQYLLVITI